MQTVAVTFKADEDQKKIITGILQEKARTVFLMENKKEDFNKIISDADLLFTWNPTKELRDIEKSSFEEIKFIQVLSAGYDHVDFNMFPSSYKIASNKGAFAEPMAEHIVAMVLAFYKKLFPNHIKLSKCVFNQKELNRSIKGSVTGILGFGGIGKATAKLLQSFGSKILAINSSGKTDKRIDFIGTINDLDYVLQNSDIIVISLPLNSDTLGLINKDKLKKMKPDAILINAARGEIIDQEDLFNHLKTHPEFSAGIDAWWTEPFTQDEFKTEYPFFDLPNLLGSPHNSAIVPGIMLKAVKLAAENILKFLEGKEVRGVVN